MLVYVFELLKVTIPISSAMFIITWSLSRLAPQMRIIQ